MTATVATHAETTQASATAIAATMPSGIVSGDLLIAFIQRDTAATITHPSGWTAPETGFSTATLTNANGFTLSFRHADGTEGVSQSWSGTSANWTACVMRITGCRAPQISATFKDRLTIECATVPANASGTITANRPPHAFLPNGQYLALFCVGVGFTGGISLSGASGALTQIANQTSGNGAAYVGREAIDLTSNPNFGDTRAITASSSPTRTGGWWVFISDPANTPLVDKRNVLRSRSA